DHGDRARLGVDGDLRVDVGEREGVRERDQIVRALRGLDGGDPRDGGDVALRVVPPRDAGGGRGRHADDRAGTGVALRGPFRAHVDHAGVARAVEVGQLGLHASTAYSG